MTESTKPVKLTKKQQLFVENYLLTLNATEAARRAGYPEKTASIIGYENLRKPYLKAEIEARFSERCMSADEVMARLGDMARADFADVLDDGDDFDFALAKASGKSHLIKKVKRTSWTDKEGNTTRTTEIELHDSQSALVQVAKYHNLFTTKIEINDLRDKKDSEIVDEFSGLVDKARTRAGATVGGGDETPGTDSGAADAGDSIEPS